MKYNMFLVQFQQSVESLLLSCIKKMIICIMFEFYFNTFIEIQQEIYSHIYVLNYKKKLFITVDIAPGMY